MAFFLFEQTHTPNFIFRTIWEWLQIMWHLSPIYFSMFFLRARTFPLHNHKSIHLGNLTLMQYYCPVFSFSVMLFVAIFLIPHSGSKDHILHLSSVFLVSNNLTAFFPLSLLLRWYWRVQANMDVSGSFLMINSRWNAFGRDAS